MKQGTFLNPQHKNEQETYILKLYKRVRGNSAYEYSQESVLSFNGRPANRMEAKSFRVLKGVNSTNNGVMVVCSNLPDEVEIDDRVEFMGKIMLIKNIGYFYNENGIENNSLFSNEYLALRCPKGITLG